MAFYVVEDVLDDFKSDWGRLSKIPNTCMWGNAKQAKTYNGRHIGNARGLPDYVLSYME